MDSCHLRNYIVRPAIADIGIWSKAAEDLVVGTAQIESGLMYLRQHNGGPALGLWQIEPNTHKDIWDNWLKYRPTHRYNMGKLFNEFEFKPRDIWLVYNLAYSAVICRYIYYRRPEPLPKVGDVKGYAAYWKEHYNTRLGAGKEEKFVAQYLKHVKG